MDDESVGITIMLFVLCLILGGCVGHGCTKDGLEKEAINAHVGEYFINTNLQKEFRWITNQPPTPERTK